MQYRYNLILSEWGWTLTESKYRLSIVWKLSGSMRCYRPSEGVEMTLNSIYLGTSSMYSAWTGIWYKTCTHAGGKLMDSRFEPREEILQETLKNFQITGESCRQTTARAWSPTAGRRLYRTLKNWHTGHKCKIAGFEPGTLAQRPVDLTPESLRVDKCEWIHN